MQHEPLGSPFACPDCHVPLDGLALHCSACGRGYRSADGLAVFNDSGLYHGPILPKPAMRELLELARTRGYRHVLSNHLPATDPEFARYVSSADRTGGLRLIQLHESDRVLDFGCAFGVFSRELAKRSALVVALDVVREKVQFLQCVKEQDDLLNLFPTCSGDPLRLPFTDEFFDWVILNTVFEYLPRSIGTPDIRHAHLLALKEFRRVLRPGGHIYIATKNRFGYPLLVGGRDIGGLRFTSFLPRRLANWVTMAVQGRPYRAATYSYGGYQRLLRDAGFRIGSVHWPFPGARYPRQFIPLTGPARARRTALAEVKQPRTSTRAVWYGLDLLGLVPWIAPCFTIIADR